MRRFISIITVLFLILSFSFLLNACGSNSDSTAADSSSDNTGGSRSNSSSIDTDKIIGVWEEAENSDRTATIEKTDTGFTWTDPEGTYPAEIKDGVMTVNAGDITAKVTYNSADDTIVADYDGTRIAYKRHKEK